MKIQDDILSYREMCNAESVQTLQRGMNFRLNHHYSVLLMSQRSNAPYNDRVHEDGITIEYEGHDMSKQSLSHDPKKYDQPIRTPKGNLTQNGRFISAINDYKAGKREVELVKIYEKIMNGVWSMKGMFDLLDYKTVPDGKRNVYRFILRLSNNQNIKSDTKNEISHTRLIPTGIKKEVWKRDNGHCVLCGDTKNLHFDHDLPFSKGGTSLLESNVRLLCMKHNLQKSAKIE